MPVSRRTVPCRPDASIAPRRTSAVIEPRNADNARCPSTIRTERTSAASGTRSVTSLRYAGSVAPSVWTAVIRTSASSSVTSTGMRVKPSADGAVPDNLDLRIGPIRSFDDDASDGDLEAQSAARGQCDGARLPIGVSRRRSRPRPARGATSFRSRVVACSTSSGLVGCREAQQSAAATTAAWNKSCSNGAHYTF